MDPATLPVLTAALAGLGLVVAAVLLLRDLRRPALDTRAELLRLQAELAQLSLLVRDGFAGARAEGGRSAADLRHELTRNLTTLGDALANRVTDLFQVQAGKLTDTTAQIAALTDGNEKRQDALKAAVEAKLVEIRTESAASALTLRDEIAKTLREARESIAATLGQMIETQREQLTHMSEAQRDRLNHVARTVTDLTQSHKGEQETLRASVEARLDALRSENAVKLEAMRATVDEKLQGTLEQRLGASFKQVSDQLEAVYKSVGEMQALATGVGDLKRVLSNVKTRGTWGEVSLGALLEEGLTAEQYGRNVEVRPGSGERVEFAIRLPGPDGEAPVWLPIDCKFPTAEYERLVAAAERGDGSAVDEAGRGIEASLKLCARTIAGKYLAPPHSTDFGVLFLPTEGLYAEVLRRPGLVDALQRDHRVLVAGPTTLWAILSSLRMGFRTLAIQKRSSDVWQVLGAVKTEFEKYGTVLAQVKKKIDSASADIEKVEVRRRAIDRKLRAVESAPESEAVALLALSSADTVLLREDELLDETAA